MALFQRYIGIDYSGAKTADDGLPGIRVYALHATEAEATEIRPMAAQRRHWSRRDLAHWLVTQLDDEVPTIVGIDHGFSFPEAYVQAHGLSADWRAVLADFHQHWPTDVAQVRVDDVRRGVIGRGQQRQGQARWRRQCEIRCAAKSVFHFDVPGSVAKSTHAGLPWLVYLQHELRERVHWWPFDGWQPEPGRSVIAEAYPSLCHDHYPRADRTADQHDAYSVAMWLKDIDQRNELPVHFSPALSSEQRATATLEGWILGC